MRKRLQIKITLEPGYELVIVAPTTIENPDRELCVSKKGCGRNERVIRARDRKLPAEEWDK